MVSSLPVATPNAEGGTPPNSLHSYRCTVGIHLPFHSLSESLHSWRTHSWAFKDFSGGAAISFSLNLFSSHCFCGFPEPISRVSSQHDCNKWELLLRQVSDGVSLRLANRLLLCEFQHKPLKNWWGESIKMILLACQGLSCPATPGLPPFGQEACVRLCHPQGAGRRLWCLIAWY